MGPPGRCLRSRRRLDLTCNCYRLHLHKRLWNSPMARAAVRFNIAPMLAVGGKTRRWFPREKAESGCVATRHSSDGFCNFVRAGAATNSDCDVRNSRFFRYRAAHNASWSAFFGIVIGTRERIAEIYFSFNQRHVARTLRALPSTWIVTFLHPAFFSTSCFDNITARVIILNKWSEEFKNYIKFAEEDKSNGLICFGKYPKLLLFPERII